MFFFIIFIVILTSFLIIPLSNSFHHSILHSLFYYYYLHMLFHSQSIIVLLLWLDAGFILLMIYLFRNSWIGLCCYIIFGFFLTLLLFLAILSLSLLFILLSYLSKFGFYPFLLLSLIIAINSSLTLLLIDNLLKFGYFLMILFIILHFYIEWEPYYILFIMTTLNLTFLLYFLNLLNSIKYFWFVGSMIAYYYIVIIFIWFNSWSLSFFSLYVLLSLSSLFSTINQLGKLSITALSFSFDFLFPINANVIVILCYLLFIFGFVPSFTFLFKLYAFSLIGSSLISYHSSAFIFILFMIIYVAFIFNGLILRNFLCFHFPLREDHSLLLFIYYHLSSSSKATQSYSSLVIGFLLLFIFLSNIGSGFFLSWFYLLHYSLAFMNKAFIINDVNIGHWVIIVHQHGFFFYMGLLYIHMVRNCWYIAFGCYHSLWLLGSSLLFLLIAELFIGYCLFYKKYKISWWNYRHFHYSFSILFPQYQCGNI